MGATVRAATQIGRFAVALGLGATVLTGWAPTGWADATDTTDNTSKSADPSSQAGADEDPSTEPTQAVTGTAEPSRTVEPEPTAAEDTAEPIAPTADTEDDNEAPDSQDPERTDSRAAAPAIAPMMAPFAVRFASRSPVIGSTVVQPTRKMAAAAMVMNLRSIKPSLCTKLRAD